MKADNVVKKLKNENRVVEINDLYDVIVVLLLAN